MRLLRSYLLVFIQFAAVIVVLYAAPIGTSAAALVAQAVAVGLGAWGIKAMRLSNLSILPDVKPGAQFVSRGPYRFIRHPMYTAVLLYTFVSCADAPSLTKSIAWGVLCVDLVVKLHFEERQLAEKFPSYSAYQHSTKRLLPWVW